MKAWYSDTFELPLPPRHRFPMSKYRLLRERLEEARLEGLSLHIPPAATDEQLRLVHHADYVERARNDGLTDLEIRRIGFPWSAQTLERSRRSVGASIAAATAALEDGISANLAGGTHHAMPESGQGFCVFNDVAVAARVLQTERRLTRVLFVDLDVHQGNGTASITAGDSTLFSFSIHCDKNYPFRKSVSDLDVALPEGTGDDLYLRELEKALRVIEDRFQPELVFYLAGADPFQLDRYGKLKLTKSGLRRRDECVLDWCRSRSIPVALAMSGGYAPDITDIVDIHFATIVAAWQRSLSVDASDTPGFGNLKRR